MQYVAWLLPPPKESGYVFTSFCLSLCCVTQKAMNTFFDKIFWTDGAWSKEQLIFSGDSDHGPGPGFF